MLKMRDGGLPIRRNARRRNARQRNALQSNARRRDAYEEMPKALRSNYGRRFVRKAYFMPHTGQLESSNRWLMVIRCSFLLAYSGFHLFEAYIGKHVLRQPCTELPTALRQLCTESCQLLCGNRGQLSLTLSLK